VVATDAQGHVERFVEKPPAGTAPSNLINAGTYVFEPSVIGRIPLGRKVSVERETFPAIVADGGLWAMPTDDYWIDTGQPDLYLQANLDVINGRRARHHRAEAIDHRVHMPSNADVEMSVVCFGAKIGDGVQIVDSVILAGAVIGKGALVDRSVVMGHVDADATVVNCVIGADGRVEAGENVADVRIPAPAS
jgi:mannose-1-phosphate guanylyltransferase